MRYPTLASRATLRTPQVVLRSAAAFAASSLLIACNEPVTSATEPAVRGPSYAVVTNPRATFTYFNQSSTVRADGKASGFVTGDNRNADGSPSSTASVYDDDRCGVKSQVFVGGSGDATMDPIGTRFKNCVTAGARVITVNFGVPLVGTAYPNATASHFSNIRQVEQLPYTGDPANLNTAPRRFRLQLRGDGMKNCDWVRYGTTDAAGNHVPFTLTISGIEVTSAPLIVQATQPNTWVATSQPNADEKHVALCEKQTKGGIVYTGAYDIPVQLQAVQR